MNVGVDVTVEELRAEFDAVVLAGGATAWRDLPIPGRELTGIYQAMEYLPGANKVQQGDLDDAARSRREGKRVVIIGGGDTGADCLGTAIRQGATSIHQFEIMPRPPETRADSTPWPTWPLHVPGVVGPRGGRRARVLRQHRVLPRRRRTATCGRCGPTRSRWSTGKFDKVEGTDFELECERVYLAMGFVGPEQGGLLDDARRRA